MSYIGQAALKNSELKRFDVTSSTSATHVLSWTAPNEQSLFITINGVKQQDDAYSIAGSPTTITLTDALVATDKMEVIGVLDIGVITVVGDNTITSGKLGANAISTAKIQDDAVTLAKQAAGTQGGTFYYGAAGAPTQLAAGTSGQFLKTQGAASNPVWGTVTEYDDAGLQDDIALLGFKVAANGSLAKYNLVDQTVDAFEDASGVDASASSGEVRDVAGKYYTGAAETAAGQTIYTADATFTSGTGVTLVTYLVVAGGGGAGGGQGNNYGGGGGGAGGLRTGTYVTASSTNYAVVVGGGGSGGAPHQQTDGEDSSFGTGVVITSAGGGRGGYSAGGSWTANPGGSGGGASYSNDPAGAGNTPSTSPSQGNPGGASVSGYNGGGGGGFGGTGGAGSSGGGTGGAGSDQSATFGTGFGLSGVVAGGGGGAAGNSGSGGSGGSGGGGSGNSTGPGADATGAGSGGGGGGIQAGGDFDGGDGSDGVVIVKWGAFTLYNDMTLVSTTTAAQAAPTKGDIVFTHTNGVGTTTLGTDVTAEMSADGGTTWTAMTLGSEGSTGSHNIATAHDVTITSTITAPYNMAYRIKTLNQSASKSTRIQAVSLGWS